MTINKHMRILILFGHPAFQTSHLNRRMVEGIDRFEHVTFHDLYEAYPELDIDVEHEKGLLEAHDCILFHFPMYWYSSPAIFKEWQDLVLEYGFAYGTEGTALHGKTFLCVLSAGGAAQAYRAEGFNHFTIRELLQPLEQTARLTGMHYLPPLALFGSRTAVEEQRLAAHVTDWTILLDALLEGHIDRARLADMETLNESLPTLAGTGQ